ncbi:MAG: TIGR02996 domain-containing protein [Gemmataceae bacterium]
MGPTQAGLLEEICEHPEDFTLRLVYADWLDDHGEAPRAEFIRLQIQREHLDETDPTQPGLRAREKQLLSAHETAWRNELPCLDGVQWREFRRGFIESASLTSVEALHQHDAALQVTAPILNLKVQGVDPITSILMTKCMILGRLHELNLGVNTSLEDGLGRLLEYARLHQLRSLLLHGCRLGRWVTCLAEGRQLTQLKELYLSGNELTNEILTPLVSAPPPWWFGLRNLDLRDNQIGSRCLTALVTRHQPLALETLWLVNNQLDGRGVLALAESPQLPHLQRLYLNHNEIGDEGVRALAGSPVAAGLRELDLRNCWITDVGAQALLASPHLERLRMLWLSGNHFRSDYARLLREQFGARLRL